MSTLEGFIHVIIVFAIYYFSIMLIVWSAFEAEYCIELKAGSFGFACLALLIHAMVEDEKKTKGSISRKRKREGANPALLSFPVTQSGYAKQPVWVRVEKCLKFLSLAFLRRKQFISNNQAQGNVQPQHHSNTLYCRYTRHLCDLIASVGMMIFGRLKRVNT